MQINMKGLDGLQGPVYVGTGCVFRRQALYGYNPPKGPKRPKMVSCDCCPCFGRRKKQKLAKLGATEEGVNLQGFSDLYLVNYTYNMNSVLQYIYTPFIQLTSNHIQAGMDDDKELMMSQMNFEKKFGQSAIFVTSTLMEQGGVPPSSSPAALLKEAIHVISCGYEDKTEWGLEV